MKTKASAAFLFLRALFLFVLLFSTGKGFAQEKVFASFPLYLKPCEVDTDCVTYARNNVSVQLDSTYIKGQFDYSYEAHYDKQGKLFHSIVSYATGITRINDYEYDHIPQVVFYRETIVEKGDTVSVLTKRSIRDDTATGKFEYETWLDGPGGEPDTLISELTIDYVNTGSKRRWSELYTNHYYFYCQDNKDRSWLSSRIYGMHNQDTLYELRLESGADIYHLDTTTSYFPDGTVAYTILRNARITETKTWKENKLVEHHTYRDSIVGIRVVQTDIYNELGGARQKEIVITYSDTLNAVKRGNDILLLDYTPDTAWFPSPLPRVPPDPTYADLFPYRTATRLNGKLVKYEFFNFYTGTIRPLLVIIKSDEGIVSYMQYADYVMRRKVW